MTAAALIGALALAAGHCESVAYSGASFTACIFDPATDDVRLFLRADDGEPYAHFSRLDAHLRSKGERLVFAMNAGMYHEDRSPVGVFIEQGVQIAPLSTRDGPGNFHMKPNGVLCIVEDGDGLRTARIARSEAFAEHCGAAHYATQSGPMLVIAGALHPRFLQASPSAKIRNGVGVREDGRLVFAISNTPVNFWKFAEFFRDRMNAPDALYLDGSISRIFAQDLGRHDAGVALGPIIGVVGKAD